MQQVAGFEDGGRGHKPRNAKNAAAEAGKNNAEDFPVEPPEESQPCKHINLGPLELIWDLCILVL